MSAALLHRTTSRAMSQLTAAAVRRPRAASLGGAASGQWQQQPKFASTTAAAPKKNTGALAGKTAIVTGSTSGIGLGIARSLAQSGANVMLNGFGDASAIEKLRADLAAEFAASGVKISYSSADMASADQIHQMVADTVAQLGGLDILVNNAGVQHVAPIDTFPPAQWDRIIAINLTSAFHTIQASLPHLKKASWGRIINIASVHGAVGSANKSAYVASKHGIIGLTKVVALENANTGVTCNAIAPGWVLTPLVQQQITDRAAAAGHSEKEAKDKLLGEKQPMLEFSTPDGLGALAVFLCSNDAKTITGTTLTMDGGWTAQ